MRKLINQWIEEMGPRLTSGIEDVRQLYSMKTMNESVESATKMGEWDQKWRTIQAGLEAAMRAAITPDIGGFCMHRQEPATALSPGSDAVASDLQFYSQSGLLSIVVYAESIPGTAFNLYIHSLAHAPRAEVYQGIDPRLALEAVRTLVASTARDLVQGKRSGFQLFGPS